MVHYNYQSSAGGIRTIQGTFELYILYGVHQNFKLQLYRRLDQNSAGRITSVESTIEITLLELYQNSTGYFAALKLIEALKGSFESMSALQGWTNEVWLVFSSGAFNRQMRCQKQFIDYIYGNAVSKVLFFSMSECSTNIPAERFFSSPPGGGAVGDRLN